MNLHSLNQDSPHQPYSEQSRAAMELINSVTGVDEEGRSRQRILTFAARRYHHITFCTLLLSINYVYISLNSSSNLEFEFLLK